MLHSPTSVFYLPSSTLSSLRRWWRRRAAPTAAPASAASPIGAGVRRSPPLSAVLLGVPSRWTGRRSTAVSSSAAASPTPASARASRTHGEGLRRSRKVHRWLRGRTARTLRTLASDVTALAAVETREFGGTATAESSSRVRAREVQVPLGAASTTTRSSRRLRVLRGAAQMSERTADVAVNLREIARVESIDAIRDHVSGFPAPETTQLLRVATGAALVRTVSTLVTGSETVET